MKLSREELIDSMQNIIGRIPTKYYADILFDSSSKLSIQKSFGDEKLFANLKNRGLVFRIFDGRKFHEVSTSLSELELLEKKIDQIVLRLNYVPKINLVECSPNTIVRPRPPVQIRRGYRGRPFDVLVPEFRLSVEAVVPWPGEPLQLACGP